MHNRETPDNSIHEEQKAYQRLRESPVPSTDLENKIVHLLKKKGLLRTDAPNTKKKSILWYAAAALILLLVGFLTGKWSSTSIEPVPKESLFLLALYEPANQKLESEQLVAEYGNWLHEVGSDGRYIGGEALKYEIRELVTNQHKTLYEQELQPDRKIIMSGYFLVEAKDLDEARKIAKECPHLKYGGAVVIREVLLQQQ